MTLRALILLFSTSIVLSACGPGRPDLRSIQANQEGNALLKQSVFPGAVEKYLEALRYDPFVSSLHLNLGLSFEGLQQVDKALQSYREAEALALKENNGEMVFMARFNQGQLLAKAKRVDEALDAYKKALEVVPTSRETRINIELLTSAKQGGGEGDGESKDGKDGQDKKDQENKDGKGQGEQDKKDPKDGEGDKEKEQKPQQKQSSPKYVPRPFKGKELSEGDVKKILGELKQQEEKIRAEYNKQEVKEQPRDKDW